MIGLESFLFYFQFLIDFKLYVGLGVFNVDESKHRLSNTQTGVNEDMHDRAILHAIVPDPPDPRALKGAQGGSDLIDDEHIYHRRRIHHRWKTSVKWISLMKTSIRRINDDFIIDVRIHHIDVSMMN